jgi:nucleoside-diphosphate-sugar epimerase
MSLKKKLLVTGANGFLGSRLVGCLDQNSIFELTCAVRRAPVKTQGPEVVVKDLDADTHWDDALLDQDVVIHLAARAHVTRDEVHEPLAEYRRVNVEGTLRLARQAAEAGAARFIFISSIGVNGNTNTRPFVKEDASKPVEPYAQSKHEAEQGLWKIGQETEMEIVIIRPPLVYGPNAPGNFGSLVRWVQKGLSLPLGSIHNQRSLVALDNLVDLIITCIDHPGAANETFLVSDGEDLSTTQLLQGVAEAMGKPSRLVPVPAGLLQFGAILLGKKAVAQRLLGSLQVDISHTQKCLNWTPPLSVKQGLQRCFPHQQD